MGFWIQEPIRLFVLLELPFVTAPEDYLPVSMLSFTIQSPDSRIQSHGTWFNDGSENSNTSPGTKSWEETDVPIVEI